MGPEISDRFEIPNDKNVEIGDFILGIRRKPEGSEGDKLKIYTIMGKDDIGVVYRDENNEIIEVVYYEAVILNKDGVLVGEEIESP